MDELIKILEDIKFELNQINENLSDIRYKNLAQISITLDDIRRAPLNSLADICDRLSSLENNM